MCSIDNRNKLTVLKYFVDAKEAGAPYVDAVIALKEKNVRFGVTGHNIEPMLVAMREFGQLEMISKQPVGGTYRITEKGKREYEGRMEYAGLA